MFLFDITEKLDVDLEKNMHCLIRGEERRACSLPREVLSWFGRGRARKVGSPS
jgi:hypothetical protein